MAQKTLFQQIRNLEYSQQAVLAAYLCERLLPNYNLFSEHVGFGDTKVLRGLLNLVWDKLSVNKGGDWERWQEKLEAVTPSDSEFDMLGVYPAMEACTALSSLVQGIADKDSAPLLDVAKISQGSVAHYLELGEFAEVRDAGQRNTLIEEHELMTYERATQEAMVEFLSQSGDIDKALISDVRKIAREEGHSNLGLA